MLRIVEGGRTTQTCEDGVPNESVVPKISQIKILVYSIKDVPSLRKTFMRFVFKEDFLSVDAPSTSRYNEKIRNR